MSALIGHWLYGLQPLPIEGVGKLYWERHAAARDMDASVVRPSGWTLKFQADAAMQLPTDFFSRLACFANAPVAEVERQYRNWLRLFSADSFAVTVPGGGELKKDKEGPIEWMPEQSHSPEPDSINVLPLSADYLYRRWDFFSRLTLIATVIALLYIGWVGTNKGFGSGLTRSGWSVKQVVADEAKLPYREIR